MMNTVKLPHDLWLPFLEVGDRAGLPVVFLHGVTDSCHSFEPLLERLPSSIRAIALTLRGHGDATRPVAGYLYEDFAGDVRDALDALRLDRAVVVGHSMGGLVAQRVAIDYPDRVLALALMGTFRTLRGHEGVQSLWHSTVSQLRDPIDPAFVRAFQRSTIATDMPATFEDLVVSESLKVPARVWRATFSGFLSSPDFSDRVASITVPTQITWGDRDLFSPRQDQLFLAERIPRARLRTYPGLGHAVHWEAPARTARDLVAFLDEAVRPAPAALAAAGLNRR